MSAKKKSTKKPTPDTLDVGLLLDESGSMCGNEHAVINPDGTVRRDRED